MRWLPQPRDTPIASAITSTVTVQKGHTHIRPSMLINLCIGNYNWVNLSR